MNSMFKKTFAKYIIVLLICFKSKVAIGEIFTLGYLTGSQRRSGNLDYHKPGNNYFQLTIIIICDSIVVDYLYLSLQAQKCIKHF